MYAEYDLHIANHCDGFSVSCDDIKHSTSSFCSSNGHVANNSNAVPDTYVNLDRLMCSDETTDGCFMTHCYRADLSFIDENRALCMLTYVK